MKPGTFVLSNRIDRDDQVLGQYKPPVPDCLSDIGISGGIRPQEPREPPGGSRPIFHRSEGVPVVRQVIIEPRPAKPIHILPTTSSVSQVVAVVDFR
jgi:hypothetical protein